VPNLGERRRDQRLQQRVGEAGEPEDREGDAVVLSLFELRWHGARGMAIPETVV
jgi:hypothetical protein